MINFYYIPAVYEPNTAATNRTLSYIKGFSELGVETNVVFFRPNSRFDKIKDRYNHINIHYYWDSLYFNNFLKYISLIIYLINFILKLKKDDVILTYGNADIWSVILRFRKDVKIFVEYTEHPEVTGIGGKFLTPSLSKFYQLLSKVDGMFVISTALRSFFISKGVSCDKIHIANITVDPYRFLNLKKNESVEKYIGYCGAVSNNKDGVDLLIKSFAFVVTSYPNIKLYIMGNYPHKSDHDANLELIKSLKLEHNIVLTGPISSTDMPQMLKNAQALVLQRPDNMQAKYGFATKIGEYLLSENPVVLTAVGDFPRFLKDGVSVVFSEPNNPQQFAEKILWVLNHTLESYEIGVEGANVAHNNFSYIKVVSNIVNILGL